MLVKNLFKYWTYQAFYPGTMVREKYEAFKSLLAHDKNAHEFMADLEEIYYGQKRVDFQRVISLYEKLSESVLGMVEDLFPMYPKNLEDLVAYFKKFDFYIRFMLAKPEIDSSPPYILFQDNISPGQKGLVGGKALALSRVKNKLGLPVPRGFTITTNAFHCFMETNNLTPSIDEILGNLDIDDPACLEKGAKNIQKMILEARLSKPVKQAIEAGIKGLAQKNKNPLLALRSSAVMEDSNLSFAGQYESLLNLGEDRVFNAYKIVIASKYSAGALYYRISHGILDEQTPMAVLVLEMVDSLASGVVYTRDPDSIKACELMIHATQGLGDALVGGEVSPDFMRLSHSKTPKILEIRSGEDKFAPAETALVKTVSARSSLARSALVIDEKTAIQLAQWGRQLESFFNLPQDIEWSLDKKGGLFILQSRPLTNQSSKPETDLEIESERTQPAPSIKIPVSKILMSGGETACTGSATGRVYKLGPGADLSLVPRGAVVVARAALPSYVTIMGKVAAFVTDLGSRASHFASVAREFRVPALVNMKTAFDKIAPGALITVDAKNQIIHEPGGMSKEKLEIKPDLMQDSPFQRKLRYVINFTSPLKLTNPNSAAFVPGECRSLHDIIRFSHETAVREMFSIGGGRLGGRKKGAKKLISPIPMLFYVLDVGGGLRDTKPTCREVKTKDIVSIPMKAVMKGLSHPGIVWSDFSHFDWESYDKIVMAGGIISADDAQFASYAVAAKEYLNINLRFGYHFVILDAYCSSVSQDNYILFRFSGGGGSVEGKSLRADFLGRVLSKLGFKVNIRSDLLDGEFRQAASPLIMEKLDYLGRLLGATRLMDMYLKENLDLETLACEFMAGRYDFRSAPDKGNNHA